jgi:ribonuclease P protein component
MTPPEDRQFFLRASPEIERVKRVGRRRRTPLFHLVYSSANVSHSQPTRFAIVVGRRLGSAVVRNRAKRVFRALVRTVRRDLVAGYDIVIFPREDSLRTPHRTLLGLWVDALQGIGALMTTAVQDATSQPPRA